MDIKDFRRELHRKAELSFEEHATAAFIAERLSEAGIEFRPIASTGLLARIEGRRGNNKRCVVLRADIDALPIAELTGVEWASGNAGVMHACGHDCHAAVLYGVLKRLQADPDFEGTVLGLFQPGEECAPGGASLVLAEKPFDSYDVEAVIGEHVDADLEVGEIGFCPGKFMASADELYFTAKGVGGHAAMRSRIKDSVVAVADLIMRLNTLNSDVCVVSVGKVTADGATNVIPERTSCAGTMRTFNENLRARVKEMIAHMAEEIEYKYDVEVEADIRHGYPCVENDPRLTYEAMLLADSCGFKVRDLDMRTTAEDFGFYTHAYPSLFYRLGVGRASGRSHTATFLPDERALEIGEEFMYRLTLNVLNR
ncbi:amidohydrolase [Alistipes sp. Z76]|nr:amidohydrolase [Alistipes sp. Z76]NCE67323.1 amidohydrolase [Muribaculaceae bacterium M3]